MVYINDCISISAQESTDPDFLGEAPENLLGGRFLAKEPNYAGLIPSGQLRRMGRALRMGVGAGLTLNGRFPNADGIVLATANGGLDDCLKFLNQIVDYSEGTLTPTNFVQSTPNAVAGSLALITQTTGYNITHVHHGLAFENALQDAAMRLDLGESERLLVGAVDEISDYNYNIDWLKGCFKIEETDSIHLLESGTAGTVSGEGATWFMLANELSDHSMAQLVDVVGTSYLKETELVGWVQSFLQKNGVSPQSIDAVVMGLNGDVRTDGDYELLYDAMFQGSAQICFKQWIGEYPTAVAFATFVAAHLLKGRAIHNAYIRKGPINRPCRYVLIYNQYQGRQHGLQLLKSI